MTNPKRDNRLPVYSTLPVDIRFSTVCALSVIWYGKEPRLTTPSPFDNNCCHCAKDRPAVAAQLNLPNPFGRATQYRWPQRVNSVMHVPFRYTKTLVRCMVL
jgi:hypothetical protein